MQKIECLRGPISTPGITATGMEVEYEDGTKETVYKGTARCNEVMEQVFKQTGKTAFIDDLNDRRGAIMAQRARNK